MFDADGAEVQHLREVDPNEALILAPAPPRMHWNKLPCGQVVCWDWRFVIQGHSEVVRAAVERAANASDQGDAAMTLEHAKEALQLSLREGRQGEVCNPHP